MKAFIIFTILVLCLIMVAYLAQAYDFSDEECAQVSSQITMDYGTFNSTYTPYYTGQPYAPLPQAQVILPVNPNQFRLNTSQTSLFSDPHDIAPKTDRFRLKFSFPKTAEAFEPYYGRIGVGTGVGLGFKSNPDMPITQEECDIYNTRVAWEHRQLGRGDTRPTGLNHNFLAPLTQESWDEHKVTMKRRQQRFIRQMESNQKGLLTYTTGPSNSPAVSALKTTVIFQGLADTNRIPHFALRVNDNVYHLKADDYVCSKCYKYDTVTYDHYTNYQRYIANQSITPIRQYEVGHLSEDQIHALHTNLFNTIGQMEVHDGSSNFIKDHFGKIGAPIKQDLSTPQSINTYLQSQRNYTPPQNWQKIGHRYKAKDYRIPTNWYSPQLKQHDWDRTTPAQPFIGPFE